MRSWVLFGHWSLKQSAALKYYIQQKYHSPCHQCINISVIFPKKDDQNINMSKCGLTSRCTTFMMFWCHETKKAEHADGANVIPKVATSLLLLGTGSNLMNISLNLLFRHLLRSNRVSEEWNRVPWATIMGEKRIYGERIRCKLQHYIMCSHR